MNENSEHRFAELTPADRAILAELKQPPRDDSDDLPLEPEDDETWVVFVSEKPAGLPEEPPAARDE